MLIDTHCHLDANEFSGDRDLVVAAACAAGVKAIIVPAVSCANFPEVRACCQRYPGCYPAYGIHPLYVDGDIGEALAALRACLATELEGTHRPVAVGEIGLDFFYPGADVASQEGIFVEQLKIAREFDLPVLLHVRGSVDQVLKGLRRIGVRGGIAHAFNGSRQQAEEFIKLGFKLGFGGAMTFSGSTRIRGLAASLPLSAIVLETDAPDIPPAWLAGARNSPAELSSIAAALADLRGLAPDDVATATEQNARAVLSLPQTTGSDAKSPEMP